jgi:hypothetical protein
MVQGGAGCSAPRDFTRRIEMKRTLLLIVLMVIATAIPAAADDTAKPGLAQALQMAAKWQPDAKLTGIGTPAADATGASRLWQYDFHSPKAKKCARVQLIKGMPPNLVDFGSCTPDKSISTGFVDSPVAMQEARKAGFKPDPDGDNSMTLRKSKDKLAKGKECWNVSSARDFDPAKSVMRGWCVDAKSGTFLMRLSGEN